MMDMLICIVGVFLELWLGGWTVKHWLIPWLNSLDIASNDPWGG